VRSLALNRLRSLAQALGLSSGRPREDGARYDVFMSYSCADKPLAEAIQRELEKLAKPWHKIKALDVFRDDPALANGVDLDEHCLVSVEIALVAAASVSEG
jgi:hypothetical protein